jgi:hypothetical protein
MSSPLGGVKSGIINDNTYISKIKFTPIWLSNGGIDTNPSPTDVQEVKNLMEGYGANFRVYTIPGVGHGTWYQMWGHPDFWPFINSSYSSNPWMIGGLKNFWPGQPISETIGIAPGFEAYEWRRNGSVISGATGNTLNVTAPGLYDARVKRDGVWSDYSHVPINIRPGFYEAESYVAMSGVQTETTTDAGGGKNVGWIDNGDWMDYTINPYTQGTFTLQLRVAAVSNGAKIEIRDSDSTVLATVTVPPTGDWQNWTTVTTTVTLPAGIQNIRLKSITPVSWNINWLQFGLVGQGSLPVKFVYFNASCQGSGASVALQWKTAEEVNSQRFSVQRSEDGVRWSEVGTVTAAGRSSGERSYSYLDKGAQGTSLYRIVEYDADGQPTISSIVRSACLGGRETVNLYPNPAASSSILSLTLQRSAAVSIRVVDARGALVEQREVVLPQGTSSLSLNTSSLSKGVYSVQVRYSGEVKTLKLIKK